MNRYDFTTDTTAAIFEYADERGLVPEFVKQSSHIGPDDVAGLHDRAFADENARLYPCHTKEATILSAIYSQAQGDDTPGVREKIASFAEAFGVQDEVARVYECFDRLAGEVQEKQAAAERVEVMQKFALTLHDEDGTEHNMYELTTPADTALTLRHLEEDFNNGRVPMPYMRKIATEVCEAAAEQGIERVPETIIKFASAGLPDYDTTKALVSLRSNLVTPEAMVDYNMVTDGMFDALCKAASLGQAMSIVDHAAAQMCALDANNGVTVYSFSTPNPYEIMYTGTSPVDMLKHAAAHVFVSDIAIPVADLRRADMDTVRGRLSKSASDTVGEVIDVLASTEQPDAKLTAACTEKLATLSPEVRKELLRTLADTL